MPAYLAEADRKLQVLRMTIALGKDQHEIAEAAEQLQSTLRAANVYVGGGRVDMGTKTAVQLAFSLGHRIAVSLQAEWHPGNMPAFEAARAGAGSDNHLAQWLSTYRISLRRSLWHLAPPQICNP